ncbi:MAG: glycosyltransferase [Anaerolineaceae bacterium]|jgi:dolichyl-phosphate beta-glucosyltransferase|nr:MAG: glycosyltransferase [Anaerolineaceae bacterium]
MANIRPDKKHDPVPQISVVIPAYDEQNWIELTVKSLATFLEKEFKSWEIIVVDDGSGDDTKDICEQFALKINNFMYLRNAKNSGKGFSVRRGMQAARGEKRYFMDADMPFELDVFLTMQNALESECDITVGARDLPGSTLIGVPFIRFLAGQIFSLLVRLFAVKGISDTQCGLKGFRAQAAEAIFSRTTINDFGMDVEVLFIAQHLGYRIMRIPVRMTGFRGDSRVRLIKDSANMFLELLLIRWNALRGIYRLK